MKQSLLSFFALGCALLSQATAPEMLWNKLIDSPQNAGDDIKNITVTADGNVVTIGCFGSRTETDNITFDSEVIATGAATNSSSDNQNLLVTKHNSRDGSLIWALSTKKGDVTSSGTNSIAATADGGVVLLVDMRSSNVTPYESPVIVDASKAEIDFPDWNTSCWIKNQVVIKVSKEGNVQWVRRIVADQLPVPNATSSAAMLNTTNGAFPYAIAEDKEGNIYIAGNHRTSLIFTGDRNSTYVLQPRNVDSYSGDTQNQAGGLYLVKLDSEGNYLTHLQGATANGVSTDYIQSMIVENDMIYFAGYFQGKANSSLTLGKSSNAKTVNKLNDNNAVLLGAVKTTVDGDKHSLVPTFLTCFNEALRPNTTSGHRIQFLNLAKADNSLFLMGSFQGGISTNESDEAKIASQSTLLEGFIVKTNATDGAYECAMANGLSIGGYRNVFAHKGSLYAHGYRMNAATGVFIDELDPNTLEIKSTTTVAKAGGAPALQACHYDPATTSIYTGARGSAAFTLTDGTTTEKPQGFGVLLACHAIDKELAGVEKIDSDQEAIDIIGTEGAIEVISSVTTNLTITDLKGVTVGQHTVLPGSTTIELPAGIYVVNNKKVAVR